MSADTKKTKDEEAGGGFRKVEPAAPKKTGFRKYELRAKHYRLGETYPVGTVVEVDANEKPSVTWTALPKGDPRHPVRLPPLPTPKTAEGKAAEDASIEASYS